LLKRLYKKWQNCFCYSIWFEIDDFLIILDRNRKVEEEDDGNDDADTLTAYVAMGGDEDSGGCVDADKLIHIIKNEFAMTIDIENLIKEIDEDGSGEIEFDEFKQ